MSDSNKMFFNNPKEVIWGFATLCIRHKDNEAKSYTDLNSFIKSDDFTLETLEILGEIIKALGVGDAMKTYYEKSLFTSDSPENVKFSIEEGFVERDLKILKEINNEYLMRKLVILFQYFVDLEYFNKTLLNLNITNKEIEQKIQEIQTKEKQERNKNKLKSYLYKGFKFGGIIGFLSGAVAGCSACVGSPSKDSFIALFTSPILGFIFGGTVGLVIGLIVYSIFKEK